jgi:hypothetical protein
MAKSSGRTINLPGASNMGGAGSVRIPEGDYRAKIVKIEQTETKDDGRSMLVLHYKINDGKHKGKVIKDRIVLVASDEKKDTLWKLRQLLEALGKKIPDDKFKLNIDNLIGGVVAATVIDGDPYKNRVKSEIGDINDLSVLEEEDDEDDDDEDEPPKKKGKKDKKKGKKDDDDEEMEEVDLDDEL